jgi:hypothetical protein
MIAKFFEGLFGVIWDVGDWLLGGIASIIQTVIDIITGFFEVIFALISGLLYLLYMIGVLATKLFQLIFEIALLIWSLVEGFGRTLASLVYTPSTTGGHGYSEVIGKVFDKLSVLQITPIAYILLFILWYTTAIAAMRLITSIRGGD